MNTTDRDPQLWRIAKARAKFKSHLFTYVLVNALLWALWFSTGRQGLSGGVPWPVWPTLFWGLGLVIQALTSFGIISPGKLSEREYERLMRERQDR